MQRLIKQAAESTWPVKEERQHPTLERLSDRIHQILIVDLGDNDLCLDLDRALPARPYKYDPSRNGISRPTPALTYSYLLDRSLQKEKRGYDGRVRHVYRQTVDYRTETGGFLTYDGSYRQYYPGDHVYSYGVFYDYW